jgi:hypothetical protein
MDDVAVTLYRVLEQSTLDRVVLDDEYLRCTLELMVTGQCCLTSCET